MFNIKKNLYFNFVYNLPVRIDMTICNMYTT